MFTQRVLEEVRNPELRKILFSKGKDKASRLEWIQDKIKNLHFPKRKGTVDVSGSLQQSDLLREFYLAIAENGLQYTFDHANQYLKPGDLPVHVSSRSGQVDNSNKHVIIVGAGMSGLVAAYELAKENYSVEILEMSQRFGGRVKTFTQKDGFDRGLHSDAGAMRIPQPPPGIGGRPTDEMIHYLTDYYALIELGLKAVPFRNSDEDAFYLFYGNRTKISEWQDSQFNDYWPGWNDKLVESGLENDITNINCYFDKTTGVIVKLLRKRLRVLDEEDLEGQAEQWDKWTNNWCQFSLGSFLRSTLKAIKSLVVFNKDDNVSKKDLQELDLYLPWPEAAITAYSTFNYIPGENVSLVTDIHGSMGKWGSPDMHSLKGGLSALPEALAAKEIEGQGKCVEQFITYNRMVTKVVYGCTCADGNKSVEVHGVITSSGEPFKVVKKGQSVSVILTVPLHVLRGIKIENPTEQFPKEFEKAIENISYTPSTKIMLQYKRQFWNHGEDKITGGFSKTNLPIGQLHYPTNVEVKGDQFIDLPAPPDKSGILMVYTWKAEALLWGALTEEQAIMLAVNQIDEIHPHIDTKALFQMGKRQAWASDPTTLGAFVHLEPREYISVMYLMQTPWKNVYFAGEAISFANGWIQGALESGLRAAYQLFANDQPTPFVSS